MIRPYSREISYTENSGIYGNGLFDDAWEERYFIHCYELFPNGNIKFYDCRNVSVEGGLFRNSSVWCVNIFHCFDCVVDNIKVFGQWRYNTDGVDVVNSQNITVNGKRATKDDFIIDVRDTDNFTFDGVAL